ncbi:MAG TPA: type IX secretion system sortase PorU [Candidatus Deferrimicrobium sp.]|nr:type IX secretion system sortase PorU [Candidatus Deferrimicrobium sp.]
MLKNSYKSFIVVLFAAASTAPARAAVPHRNPTILASSETEFHFSVTCDLGGLERSIETDSSITYFQTVQVGIPFGAAVTIVSAVGDSLQPLPEPAAIENLSRQFHPLAEVSAPITVRGRQIVAIRIFPAAGESFYRVVTVRLAFSGTYITTPSIVDDPQFDRIFGATLANFDEFRGWPVPAKSMLKVSQAAAGPLGTAPTWYKIAVNQTGLFKVYGAQLEQAGLNLGNLPSDSLHLFNAGGLALPVQNDRPRPDFREVAILVEDGGDGVFQSRDYLLFYGEAVDRWLYVPNQSPRFENNPYTDRNVYWLAVSGFGTRGLRMTPLDATPSGEDTVITTLERRMRVEQDSMLERPNDGEITDYYAWYWTNAAELTFFVPTPGILDGQTASVWLSGHSYGSSSTNGFIDLTVNGVAGQGKSCNRYNCSYTTSALFDGLNEIRLRLWPQLKAPPYFDYLNLTYTSALLPVDNELDMSFGSYTGVTRLEVLDNLSFPALVLDLTDPLRPAVLTGYERAGGLITIQVNLASEGPNHFFVATAQNALSPLSIEESHPTDLRAAASQVDLLVITPQSLAEALDDFIAYRQPGRFIAVVTVEDIMDNFGYGLYDPTAIRDFLKFAYENYPNPAPSAVLLVGDGTYDYLDHLGTGVLNYVPPYIHSQDSTASDDNYVYFGVYGILDSDTSYLNPDRGYDMVICRWPVRSPQEIRTILDKTKRYESPATLGAWRTNVALVADDEFGNYYDGSIHVEQTETLEKAHLPRLFQRDKIYLWEYPFVNREKPAVNDAIVKTVNEGTLIVNYVGHGNPDVWAHEHVFTRVRDVARLNNADRLPLFFAASCAIGFFDDPRREGMAEDLLNHPAGGGIGVVSATRLVFSSDNAAFNRKVFDVLFEGDSLSIAEAVYVAKLLRQYQSASPPRPNENDRAYLFFGDPYVRLGTPRLQIEFSDPPISLTALGQTRITGRVKDRHGVLYSRNGTLLVNVYDSERQKAHNLTGGGTTTTIEYSTTGPTIFRGSATIADGEFEFSFVAPLDVGYGGQGARIVAYAVFDSTDAAGLIDSLAIADSVIARADSAGPIISYRFRGRAGFMSGDIVTRQDMLEVTLTDPSGINLTGDLGHGVTLELDGRSESTIDLTDRFAYEPDAYTSGKLSFPLADLEVGRHTMKIKAWDNVNNSTSMELAVEMAGEERLAIIDLLNYPNPMKDSTRFSAYLSHPVEQFYLEIFSLSGRKIKQFGPYRPQPGYYDDIVWQGRDDSGDRVATGVYIYKATAIAAGNGEKAESFGKVVVTN